MALLDPRNSSLRNDDRTQPVVDPGDGPNATLEAGNQLGLSNFQTITMDPVPGVDGPVPEPFEPPVPEDTTALEQVQHSNILGIPGGPSADAPTASTPQLASTPEAVAPSRQVTSNELVENRLNSLLAGDSEFITNARRRGAELANRRGQFDSSLMAGTANRAAIESALPIATADAQAYRDAATQNLAALTQTRLANLDSATRISMANLDAMTRTNIANLDAATRVKVQHMAGETQKLLQSMQSELQLTMQSRSINHERELENFRQDGRMELAQLDADLRRELQEQGFAHDINMSELDAAEQLELSTIMAEYELERQSRDHALNERQSHVNMAMQAQINYTNYLASFAGTEMDAAAASRLQEQADAQLVATFDMINGLYPNQPPIQVQFGEIGGG